MDEDKQIIDAAKALGLSELAPEVYRDMLQPAARQAGDGLATIAKAVKISLAPLEVAIWGYEQIKAWLSIRVTRILADREITKIEKPPLSIAGPLVFQLIFVQDEPELKELYASLLASAMDPSETSVHPSFVSIIQQLTSDEAKILRHIAHLAEAWPCLSEGSADTGAKGTVSFQFKNWGEKAGASHLDRSDAYLDNLLRLRILHHLSGSESKYEPGGHNRYGDYEASISNTEYAFIELTVFGRLFINACIEKTEPNK
jgi:hypothetical protein